MNSNHSENVKISFCKNELIVGYSRLKHGHRTILVKAQLKSKNSPSVIFQFYREFKASQQNKWVLDKENSKEDPPYYGNSCAWSNGKWSDTPLYNLGSIGSIIFCTFLADVDKRASEDPKKWGYRILCGFIWGMVSKDGSNATPLPIKPIMHDNIDMFAKLLKAEYIDAEFNSSRVCDCRFESTKEELW